MSRSPASSRPCTSRGPTTEREPRSWVATGPLILDDFGLRKLTAQQSSDFYDVLVECHTRASTIVTSNRAVNELVALFDDPILANSALDRFAHRAHQIIMEGPSLRAATAPSRAKGVASGIRRRYKYSSRTGPGWGNPLKAPWRNASDK